MKVKKPTDLAVGDILYRDGTKLGAIIGFTKDAIEEAEIEGAECPSICPIYRTCPGRPMIRGENPRCIATQDCFTQDTSAVRPDTTPPNFHVMDILC